MVPTTGGAVRSGSVRSLNKPRPARVVAGRYGEPLQVASGEWRWPVRRVRERWRIDDRWWTEDPVSRLYWELELESGEVVTLFHDQIGDAWYRQHHR